MAMGRNGGFDGFRFKTRKRSRSRDKALLGGLFSAVLVAMVIAFGDGRQLAMAGALTGAGLAMLWGLRRLALAVAARRSEAGATAASPHADPSGT